jgi:hypothetical protein
MTEQFWSIAPRWWKRGEDAALDDAGLGGREALSATKSSEEG